MDIREASDPAAWDDFLVKQRFTPFLQSWTMGEVYRDIGQDPIRLEVFDGGEHIGICFGMVVPARRGKHIAVPYGPVLLPGKEAAAAPLLEALREYASAARCSFIRLSPFWPLGAAPVLPGTVPSPLHLLAEHVWYLPLWTPDPWMQTSAGGRKRTEEEIFKNMRSTTRNLIRRAEREGVTVEESPHPEDDLQHFLRLHEETRLRHKFTPYPRSLFIAQVRRFAARGECIVYLARFEREIVAASIHMRFGGETSYHHGASSMRHPKIPGSLLLQWRAIQDSLNRGDRIYSFWGIAPEGVRKHPFAGVTLFKTGFGGSLLPLVHCLDLPIRSSYTLTRAFELLRKWRRGF